jgi:hypothetical protein
MSLAPVDADAGADSVFVPVEAVPGWELFVAFFAQAAHARSKVRQIQSVFIIRRVNQSDQIGRSQRSQLIQDAIAAVNGCAISIWSAPTCRRFGRRDLSQQVCENASSKQAQRRCARKR